MPEDRNILIEDDQGNRYFPHTKASNVVDSNGKTAEDAISKADAALPKDGSQAMTGALNVAANQIAIKNPSDTTNTLLWLINNNLNKGLLFYDAGQGRVVLRLVSTGSNPQTEIQIRSDSVYFSRGIESPGGKFTANPTIEGTIPRLIMKPTDGTSNSSAGVIFRDHNAADKFVFGRQMNNGNMILYDYDAGATAFYVVPGAGGIININRPTRIVKGNEALRLDGDSASQFANMGFYNNGSTRSGWLGYGSTNGEFSVSNGVTNGNFNVALNGTGQARVNGQQIWDNSRLRVNNGKLEFLDGSTWKQAGMMAASGTATVTNGQVTVGGLNFTPSIILTTFFYSSYSTGYVREIGWGWNSSDQKTLIAVYGPSPGSSYSLQDAPGDLTPNSNGFSGFVGPIGMNGSCSWRAYGPLA